MVRFDIEQFARSRGLAGTVRPAFRAASAVAVLGQQAPSYGLDHAPRHPAGGIMNSLSRTAAAVVIVVAATAMPLMAQPVSPPPESSPPLGPRQVVSANPFGLVIDLFNVEYERRVGRSVSAGVGGSFLSEGDDDYLNADVFVRYYPGARPLAGVAFGVKAGMTHVDDGSYFGVGFDINWSWTLGKGDHFYMGTGFGLKRLFGTGDADLIDVLPTFRILNVGIAF